ncbi:MAG: hypothetical protein ACHQ53_14470 [Polyangiales bacterium]
MKNTRDVSQWLLVAAALGLAPWLFSMRGSPPGPGSVIEAALTLITADKNDLSCALLAPPRGYRCGYVQPGVVAQAEVSSALLQPFLSLDRQMFLLPSLFAERNVARRYLDELPLRRPREQLRRFTARCRLRLVTRVASAFVRFGPNAPWGPAPPLFIADVLSCRVEG